MSAHDPMRTCEEARAVLGDYLEGLLDGAAQGSIAAHLAGCPECRAVLAKERELFTLLAGMGKSAAPAGFSQRVMAALFPAPAPWRYVRDVESRPSIASRASLAGALLLLLLIMGQWFNAGSAGAPGPERLRDSAATALLEGGRELTGTVQVVERTREHFEQFARPTLDKFQSVLRIEKVLVSALLRPWLFLIVLVGLTPPMLVFTVYRLRVKGAMSNVMVLARIR